MTDSVPQLEAKRPINKRWAAVHEAGHALGFKNPNIRARIDNVSIAPDTDTEIDEDSRTTGRLNWTPKVAARDNATIRARLIMVLAGPTAAKVALGLDEKFAGTDKDAAQRYAVQLAMNSSRARSGKQSQARQTQTQQSMQAQQVDAATMPEPEPQPAQVEKILTKAWAAARVLVEKNLSGLNAVADALLEREELTGDEVRTIFRTAGLPTPHP